MSKINPSLYSSDRQDWQTPPDFLAKLLDFCEVAQFDVDPCCTAMNVPAKAHFQNPYFDGLKHSWMNGLVFMNPPYDKCEHWIKKAIREAKQGCRIWGLFPVTLNTIYWHDWVFQEEGFVVFLRQRLKFWINGQPYQPIGENGEKKDSTASFPAALVYWGSDHKEVQERYLEKSPFAGVLINNHFKCLKNNQLKVEDSTL